MAHASQTAVPSALTFMRLVRQHLMSRRDIADLRTPGRSGARRSVAAFPDPSGRVDVG